MPTTAVDVANLRQRNQAVVALAKRALSAFWATLDLTRPEAARDALLEFMPSLVATYGEAAAAVAADWYEGIRTQDVGGRFTALLADAPGAEQVQSTVRYQASHLFTDNPVAMLTTLGGEVQRYVAGTGRRTITSNALRDRARPKYARIPVGKTCAFCTLLASRGFVYASKKSAGAFNKFHRDDDCETAISFEDDPRIDGYNPSELLELYSAARSASGSSSLTDITAEMRRQNPDRFTDGVADAH